MSTIIFGSHRSADCAGTVLLRRLSHEHHDQQPLPPHHPPQSMARRRSRSALRKMGAGGRRHAPARRVDGRRRSRGMTQCQSADGVAQPAPSAPPSARSWLGSTVGPGSDTGTGTSTEPTVPRAGLRPAWTCRRPPGSAILCGPSHASRTCTVDASVCLAAFDSSSRAALWTAHRRACADPLANRTARPPLVRL